MEDYSDVSLDGVFIAKVLNNIDSEFARERLFVRVIGVHDISDNFKNKEFGVWADHCTPSLYRTGDIPDIDDEVYVQFMRFNGKLNPNVCIWLGCVLKNNITR